MSAGIWVRPKDGDGVLWTERGKTDRPLGTGSYEGGCRLIAVTAASMALMSSLYLALCSSLSRLFSALSLCQVCIIRFT